VCWQKLARKEEGIDMPNDPTAFVGSKFVTLCVRPSGRGRVSQLGWTTPKTMIVGSEDYSDKPRYIANVFFNWPEISLIWLVDHGEHFSSWTYLGKYEGQHVLAIHQLDGRVVLRAYHDGDAVESCNLPSPSSDLVAGSVLSVTIDYHDGNLIYTSRTGLEVYHVASGQCIHRVARGDGSLRASAVSPSGLLAYVFDDCPIDLFDLKTGLSTQISRQLTPWSIEGGTPDSLVFHKDQLIVTAGWNETPPIYLIDANKIEVVGVVSTGFERNYGAMTAGDGDNWVVWGTRKDEWDGVDDLRLCYGATIIGRASSFQAEQAALSPDGCHIALLRDNLLHVGRIDQLFRPINN